MRKLGNGQSVVFCVPKEIKLNILHLNKKNNESSINVSDVLCWAMSETWAKIRRSMPLWAVQGNRFERQLELWHDARQGDSLGMTPVHAEGFLEPECQSIEQRYKPTQNEALAVPPPRSDHKNLRSIFERCREFENLDFRSSTLLEEQGRELTPEIETERQAQRPPEAAPSQHHIYQDLYSFVNKGELKHAPMHTNQPSKHWRTHPQLHLSISLNSPRACLPQKTLLLLSRRLRARVSSGTAFNGQ